MNSHDERQRAAIRIFRLRACHIDPPPVHHRHAPVGVAHEALMMLYVFVTIARFAVDDVCRDLLCEVHPDRAQGRLYSADEVAGMLNAVHASVRE